jgi:hypothetical protein
VEVTAPTDGWIAARASSQVRDSYFQPVYAHSSPVYVTTGRQAPELKVAAQHFERAIEQAIERIQDTGRFQNAGQRNEVVELFRRGQQVYKGLQDRIS